MERSLVEKKIFAMECFHRSFRRRPAPRLLILVLCIIVVVLSNEAKAISTTTVNRNTSDQQQQSDEERSSSIVVLESLRRESIGPSGAYYAFDGVDDYIIARDVRGLPSRTISACAWVFVNRHKSFNRIVSHEWINWGWNLYTDTQGVARFGIGKENKDFSAGKVLFLNRWHFVCGTYDGRAITVFVDGAAGPQVPLEESGLDFDGHVTIGGAEWDPFDGRLDDVSIWNRALTPAEVRRLMVVGMSSSFDEASNMNKLDDPTLIWMVKDCVAFWTFDEETTTMHGEGNKEVFLHDSSGRGNVAYLGRGSRMPKRYVNDAPPSRIPCVSKSGYSSHDDSDDARKDIPREKIDLNVDYEEGGKNAKLVFRVISVYPSDLIQLSLRYDKFDKYEDGENVVIDTSYTIDPSLDPKDIKNLNALARSVFVEMAPLELEWETDDLDMECATIVFEAKIIEDGTDVNDEDIPWSTRTVLVDITEQPELCQVFDSLKASRIGAGSCTEKRKEVRQIRPKREYAEFVEKTDRERREIVSEFIEDSAIGALPFVSVVVPFYNGAKETLEETLSSVYSQTYKNIEVLLIDDGSKDGSSEVARQLVDRFNQKGGRLFQIQVHEKQNGGLGDARNFGFDRAIGKYVLPLDADDLIDETFIEKAIDLLEDPNNDYNLAVADLVGFGDWEYSWNLPKYDPQDLRYFNAFHCSAVILKSLWDNTPGGYPRTTLFGYEDWAFWLEAEKYVGLKPVNIREPLFKYRLRKGSMLQSMIDGKNELFALASVRMLNPITYPVELILSAHDMFNERDVTREIVDTLTAKLTKFQRAAMPALMLGIYFESNGKFPEAGQMYLRAIEITDGTNDWQPRWRNGLLLQKVGNYDAANVTLSKLFKDFDGLEQVYEEKRKRTPSMFGAILAPSVVEKRRNLRMENNNSDNNVNKSSKKYTGGGGANKNDEL